jgi:plastocyanin
MHEMRWALTAIAAVLLTLACAAPLPADSPPSGSPPAVTPSMVAPTATLASPPPAVAPRPSPTTSGQSSPGGGPVALTIGTDTSNQTTFIPDQAAVRAGAVVRVTFENLSTTRHNLTFGPPIDANTELMVEPGASDIIEFTAPQPGQYLFVCTLHPSMVGTLTVQGP